MATIAQLESAYTSITRLTPNAAQSLILQDLAARSQAGVITDTQAYQYIISQANGTTSVAALSYQFFTGKTPTSAGFDYLVNSSTNTSDLNDPAYQNFNTENRYINFAINLGVVGEGRTNFAATFGGLSFADTVAVAYNRIIGNAQATAAGVDVTAAIANISGRKAYFDAVVAQAGITAADRDLAAKAAVVGYIMAEAVKANVGVYSNGLNNFYLDLAPDKTANYNVDLNTYVNNDGGEGGPGVPGNFITLANDTSYSVGNVNPNLRTTDNNDTLQGNVVVGTAANQTVATGNGADTYTGEIDGDAGTKTFTVDLGAGNDTFKGDIIASSNAAGDITVNLGAGNDTLTSTITKGTGQIALDGGDGTDTATLTLATDFVAADISISKIETINFVGAAKAFDASVITGATSLVNTGATNLTLTNIEEGVSVSQTGTGEASFTFDGADDATLVLSGSTLGKTTIAGVDDSVTVSVTKNSTLTGGLNTSAAVLKIGGAGEIALGTIDFTNAGANVSHTIDASAATKAVAFTYVTEAAGTGTDTITLGAGNDAVTLTFNNANSTKVTLGGGNDTVTLTATGAANNFSYATTGGSLKTVTEIVDFTKGADHINASGAYLDTTGNAAYIGLATIQDFVGAASTLLNANGAAEFTVFEFGGSTYLLQESGANDTLVRLTGVTGVNVSATGATSADIY